MKSQNDVQVSVCIVTYNQENYIAECLESLVSQKTNFKFEIIVGEDCSTDATRSVVQKYVERYPELIVPLFFKENVGAVENVKQVYLKAKGKYIAHMDGDDLALPNKLQKQFNSLEENPDAVICSHNVREITSDSTMRERSYWFYSGGQYSILDLLKKLPFFAHSSKFFRVDEHLDWNELLKHPYTLDIEIHVEQARSGSILHLEEDLGLYRINTGVSSISSCKINAKIEERVFLTYEKSLARYPQFKIDILKAYASYLLNMANNYAVIEGNKGKFKFYTKRSLNLAFFSVKQILMLLLTIYPSFGIYICRKRAGYNTIR